MCVDVLNDNASSENAKTLAKMLGVTHGEAGKLLNHKVTLAIKKNDAKSEELATEIKRLLERTISSVKVEHVDAISDMDVYSEESKMLDTPILYIYLSVDKLIVNDAPLNIVKTSKPHSLLTLLSACYSTGAILHKSLSLELSAPQKYPLLIKFHELIDPAHLDKPIDLGETYLAGGGAVGNGLIWAFRNIDIMGQLHICDDDIVDSSNINRQIFFTNTDIGEQKALVLSEKAQKYFKKLTLIPHPERLENLPQKESGGPWLKRLIVGVDSRRVRRRLQEECPGEVFDVSTTDITEIVLYYNKQPNDKACLGCIYYENKKETSLRVTYR